jgi:hypothetical protein
VSDIRFFDELEAELERAARRRLARRGGSSGARLRPWSLSRGLSALVVAAGAAAAVGVAVIALVALHHGRPSSSPPATTGHHFKLGPRPRQPGPIPRDVADGVIANAYNTAAKRDPACGPRRQPVGGAKVSTGTPSAAMLSTLPVLNHPATSLDRLPASLYFRGRLGFGSGLGEVYGRYIRRARVADGITFYLVPAGGLGQPPLSPPAAERCYRLLVAALASQLPGVPRAERAATRRYGDAGFAYDRYNLETTSVHEGVFLFEERDTGGGGGADGGQTPATIRQTGILGEIGGGKYSTPVMDGIVPARVAIVTLQFPATRQGNHHLPPLSATGDVVKDVFAIRIPTLFERGGWPSDAIWRSASGEIIKTVNERPFHP